MINLYKHYLPEELPELESILRSGQISYGKWGKAFEKRLGDYVGEPNTITTSSFNSAMLLAILVLGLKPGDEIIASPLSCLASNQPFATSHLKVIWADIDPETGSLSPKDVKSKITVKTKAIFHNHFCGYIGYINEIHSIAKEHGLYLVDDAIEAFGSSIRGKKMGNLGADITVYSFQTIRLPNTLDGGGLSFNNKELYDRAILARDYGVDRSKFRDELGEISSNCDINSPGYGATLSEVNSYIGLMQMEKLDDLLRRQNQNAKVWDQIFDSISDIKPIPIENGHNPNYWVYGVLCDNKNKSLLEFRKKGYYTSNVHLPNNYYSVFGTRENLAGVTEFYSRFMALPCGWWFKLKEL
jgi:perosamine synthetase